VEWRAKACICKRRGRPSLAVEQAICGKGFCALKFPGTRSILKVDIAVLDQLEEQYPGIKEMILQFEAAHLPTCAHCASSNIAKVQVGIIGRTITIAAATTKLKLIPNGPRPGGYFCNACKAFFNDGTQALE
jgi:hypothetical protein